MIFKIFPFKKNFFLKLMEQKSFTDFILSTYLIKIDKYFEQIIIRNVYQDKVFI